MKSKRASSGKHIRAKGGTKVKRSPTGLLLAAVGVIVVLLLVVYFTIASSYKGRFLGRTTINGLNCSGKTAQEVNTAMNLQAKNYVLTLKERDGKTETINGGDIDLNLRGQRASGSPAGRHLPLRLAVVPNSRHRADRPGQHEL